CRAAVQVRYRAKPVPCEVRATADGAELGFDTPITAVVKGQHAVLYDGDRVLGGGTIVDAIKTEPGESAA
ncbi:MAG: tRNA 2-thiouridine(34) synthase MnmA, partial [Myxococcota bacterium]|nr:tRNA 2-thiouridine(34) synthase MnmA [Myxococcota bacterium]